MLCKQSRFLYGPRRETATNPYKEFIMKSSVFPKNASNKQREMETTNSACFGKKTVELDRETAKLSTEIQRTSNFKFGSDENCPLITTKTSEFSKNILPVVKRVTHDFYSTNIPDFSPSEIQDKITDGGSVYVTSYKTPKNCSKSLGKSREHLKSQTEDMRSTHFDFGSEKQSKCSETSHSYNERNYADPNKHNEPHVIGPSSVFRSGDWNMGCEGSTCKSSVTHDHFSDIKENRNPVQRIENRGVQSESVDDAQKRDTSFKTASEKYLISSLYKKDFRQLDCSTPHYPLKTLREVRPKSAKVLNQTSKMICPISTEQSDFIYRQKEADNFLKKRSLEYKKNQEKDKICSVVLDDADNDRTKHTKPVSMSEKDYQLPPIELLRQRMIYRRPTPLYDYIMLDKCSPDNCQNTTDSTKTLLSSSTETKAQLAAHKKENKPRDDHQTHFTFGSDIQRFPNSEQVYGSGKIGQIEICPKFAVFSD